MPTGKKTAPVKKTASTQPTSKAPVKKRAKKAAKKKAPTTARKTTRKTRKKAPSEAPNASKAVSEVNGLPIVHDSVYCVISTLADGEAFSAAQAKKLLGWQEVEDGEHLLKDVDKKKIVTRHNETNRPFYLSDCLRYKQEILNGKWHLNGVTFIISETGQCLNCQHRLIALVLAAQEWKQNPHKYEFWDSEPCVDAITVFGISDDDAVVNTIDTGRPRSFTDAIYRSAFFEDRTPKEKKVAARAAEFAIRCLWERTGAKDNAHAPDILTHSEALDFLTRHPKLIEAIDHVVEENGEGNSLRPYIGIGYAAALLYLMATSNSDAKSYRSSLSESSLDFENLDKAEEYFVLLAGKNAKVKPVLQAIADLGKDDERNGSDHAERLAIVVKGWIAFADTGKVTPSQVALKYRRKDDDDFKQLAEAPSVGGIDVVISADVEVEDEPPTSKEIEERAAKIRASRKTSSTSKLSEGDMVTVSDDGEAWIGIYRGEADTPSFSRIEVPKDAKVAGAGRTFDVPNASILKNQ